MGPTIFVAVSAAATIRSMVRRGVTRRLRCEEAAEAREGPPTCRRAIGCAVNAVAGRRTVARTVATGNHFCILFFLLLGPVSGRIVLLELFPQRDFPGAITATFLTCRGGQGKFACAWRPRHWQFIKLRLRPSRRLALAPCNVQPQVMQAAGSRSTSPTGAPHHVHLRPCREWHWQRTVIAWVPLSCPRASSEEMWQRQRHWPPPGSSRLAQGMTLPGSGLVQGTVVHRLEQKQRRLHNYLRARAPRFWKTSLATVYRIRTLRGPRRCWRQCMRQQAYHGGWPSLQQQSQPDPSCSRWRSISRKLPLNCKLPHQNCRRWGSFYQNIFIDTSAHMLRVCIVRVHVRTCVCVLPM